MEIVHAIWTIILIICVIAVFSSIFLVSVCSPWYGCFDHGYYDYCADHVYYDPFDDSDGDGNLMTMMNMTILKIAMLVMTMAIMMIMLIMTIVMVTMIVMTLAIMIIMTIQLWLLQW